MMLMGGVQSYIDAHGYYTGMDSSSYVYNDPANYQKYMPSVYWQVPIFFLSGISEIIGKSILPLPLLLPLPLSLSLSLSSPSPSFSKAPRRRPLLTHTRAHPQVTSPHSSSHTSDRPRP